MSYTTWLPSQHKYGVRAEFTTDEAIQRLGELEHEQTEMEEDPFYRLGALIGMSLKSQTPALRPCEVNGKPAVFHRWVDEDRMKVQINIMTLREEAIRTMDDYKVHGFLPATASPVVLRQTIALVEYEDGTVCKVEPEDVKFTDRRAE